MKYNYSTFLLLGTLLVVGWELSAQPKEDSIYHHSVSLDVLRSIVRNSVEFTYEHQTFPKWSFLVTIGGHFSTPGEDLYGQDGILYNGKTKVIFRSLGAILDSRKSKGVEWRGGVNRQLGSHFLLSSVLGYRYSYYNRRLVCYGDCPPRVGYADGFYSKMDQYYLLIESRKTHVLKLDIVGRWRWSFKRLLTEAWIGVGGQYDFVNKRVHEEIPQHFDHQFQPQYCSTPGCSTSKGWKDGGLHVMAGIKIGYQFN